jgi:hypothetical protein
MDLILKTRPNTNEVLDKKKKDCVGRPMIEFKLQS